MKINVLHIIDSLLTGGAETIAVNTVNELNKVNNIKAFLCCTRKEGPLFENITDVSKYCFLDKKKIIDFKALKRLSKFIKKNEISILHAHTTSFFIAVLIKFRFPSLKIIWHNHTGSNEDLYSLRLFFIKFCSCFFSAVLNVSIPLKKWVSSNLYVKQNYMLNNFANLTNLSKNTNLVGDGIKIVCLAALRPEKDHLNLLNAFKEILFLKNDISLHLVGTNYNDSYFKSIQQYIVDNKLKNKVFIYGNCKDVNYILSQASLGVLASKSEGLPISLLEYGLKSLPVVVTNVGECSEVVKNTITGCLVEKENTKELKEAILFNLKENEKSKILGVNLNKFVIKKYGVKNYINELLNIYRNI